MSEKEDAKTLLEQTNDIRINAFLNMSYIMRLTPKELTQTGHKTIEAALLYTMKSKLDDIKKLEKEFLQKHPD